MLFLIFRVIKSNLLSFFFPPTFFIAARYYLTMLRYLMMPFDLTSDNRLHSALGTEMVLDNTLETI
jgi:hypothetical protein